MRGAVGSPLGEAVSRRFTSSVMLAISRREIPFSAATRRWDLEGGAVV